MRVVIAGGGTGGHVIPALAIARELQARYAAEVLFIGTPRGIENKMVPASGFPLKLVQVGALKNVSAATRAKTAFDLPRAILAARGFLRQFKADVVVGVGGYASGPAMIAAILSGVPTLAFEPNLVPGFANRVVAKFVSAAAVHFPDTARYFRNARVTGVPVRKEFFAIPQHQGGIEKTLLVTGGSQGSRALNRVVTESVLELHRRIPALRIIHQTGEKELDSVRAAYAQLDSRDQVSAFISDMPAAFERADLLLCRSGAGTVAEIAAAGKVAIFVPFPHAADDHQRKNAEAFVARGAAVLVPEPELTSARLIEEVVGLLDNQSRLRRMSENARAMAHADVAAKVAEMVRELTAKKG
jgi:UDP-N-acetylglucosamine--N-acetylmuramyl-(pentapeptide) pyrophosphoryl-undecaprenol N-acetylglucosamine transferase